LHKVIVIAYSSSAATAVALICHCVASPICREDDFVFESKSLGDLKRLRIRQDNAGSLPGWFVDSVTVCDLKTYNVYTFPCNQWLATDEGDGAVERELVEECKFYIEI
jgi:PLAT/LH2 domain